MQMETLKKSFEAMGFKNVKTFIQSGNVLFDSAMNNLDSLTKKIEMALFDEYGSDIKVMLRTFEEVEKIVQLNVRIQRGFIIPYADQVVRLE